MSRLNSGIASIAFSFSESVRLNQSKSLRPRAFYDRNSAINPRWDFRWRGQAAHRQLIGRREDCLARTERFELLNSETRGKRWGNLALNFHHRKEWTSAAEGASLSSC